jgi:hypothetical protein
MATMHRTAALLAVIALSADVGSAMAQAPSDSPAPSQSRVLVRSGGVGTEEAALFKQDAAIYPLRVVFSAPGGEYAVPDRFTILQDGRVVSQTRSTGPWHLIDVPPGSYVLQAAFADRVVERTVTVGATGSTLQWVVPAPQQ